MPISLPRQAQYKMPIPIMPVQKKLAAKLDIKMQNTQLLKWTA